MRWVFAFDLGRGVHSVSALCLSKGSRLRGDATLLEGALFDCGGRPAPPEGGGAPLKNPSHD